MKIIERSDLAEERLPGRVIHKAIGKDGFSPSGRMTMGFARYSAESGKMEPHHHAEEIIFVLDAMDAWARYGDSPEKLGDPHPLEAGMILHFPVLEWHVFEYDEGGFLDILFFYGQVDHIRPEEIEGV